MNRAVREELGHAGTDKLVMKNGIRDFVPGDRVVFEKNDLDLDVKNGYCGTVKAASNSKISARLFKVDRATLYRALKKAA